MINQPSYAPGLRMAAAELNGRVDRLSAVISRVDTQIASMTYAGPAADRFRSSLAYYRSELMKTHANMTETVNILNRAAQSEESSIRNGAV